MYLKSIEVQGFKSFANKIRFDFHNGITGIVGPNGSGKSNVADAVRWVLGEQRVKQLRGAKMEDVIFAGTENRKPLGFAYVAITMDNSDHKLAIDFDEVTVSRRIFRSGESEYMINGATCRLKDINELFYDTGIGKEGYSIIGQGQIDKILSGKPEERRELFDEAVGIVKFKKRKAVTCKKLEDERANIVRIKDILSELEKQVGPLKDQSETAKEYLKLRDELKTYDINGFLLESDEIKNKILDVNNNIGIVTSDLEKAKAELELSKLDYEKLGLILDELEDSIEEKKNKLNLSKIQVEKLEGDVKVINEQINAAKSNDEMFDERIKSLDEQISNNQADLESLKEEKEKIEDTLNNATSLQNDEDTKLAAITDNIDELNEQVENAKTEIIELLNKKSSVKTKLERYETMLEQIERRKNELSESFKQHESDSKEQEELIAKLKNELEEVSSAYDVKSAKVLDITNKIKEIDINTSSLNKKYEDCNRIYHRDSSRLESLKNITERYEGYNNSIRKVMELKEQRKGIIGVVADIIKTEQKYEIAIETALGGSIQNIVTDDEKCAKDIIEYLKKNKFGRATFLPLSSIGNRAPFNNENVLREKGVVGLASDLVNIKKEYSGVAKYLLGRIVVVDHIDNALLLARKYNYSLRIVTLEGELLNVGGSLTGGAYKNTSNLLGRRREIEDLEKSVDEFKALMDNLSKQLESEKEERGKLSDSLEGLKLELQEQALLKNTVSLNIKQAGEKFEELESSFKNIEKENAEIEIQVAEINDNNNVLKDELQSIEDENKKLEDSINDLNAQIDAEKEKENAQSKKAEEMRIEHSKLFEKNSFVADSIKRLEAEIKRIKAEKEELVNNRAGNSEEIENKLAQIEEIKISIEKGKDEIVFLNDEIEADIKNKEEQASDHKDFLNKRDEISEKINTLEKEILRLDVQKEKHNEALESKVAYIWEQYELTLVSAAAFRNEELTNLNSIKRKTGELKSSIKALGDVNVNAIEEYKSVSERYEFLNAQHEDLIEAEANLVKIIEELDDGMRKQFNSEFEKIRSEFDKVFKELFGGGKGTIELDDEDEDVLETSITITAQPPGKKLQNMMQLSGGEKALTAIALLFAIQNLKPSPFCLLDEIEAALDDSNVGRFAGYLHKLTEFTQFIVITHRKGTMSAADRLYGITMQEKGVSALVSVDLLENELDK